MSEKRSLARFAAARHARQDLSFASAARAVFNCPCGGGEQNMPTMADEFARQDEAQTPAGAAAAGG